MFSYKISKDKYVIKKKEKGAEIHMAFTEQQVIELMFLLNKMLKSTDLKKYGSKSC